MTRRHEYRVDLEWTGGANTGTADYRSYSRDHEVRAPGKPVLLGSSDPTFRGDPARWSPEELLVVALSQCHMLWYLHLAAVNGVIVTAYADAPRGEMQEGEDGGGHFTAVTLRPRVQVSDPAKLEPASELHAEAHRSCFIANSVAFPVRHEPVVTAGTPASQAGQAEPRSAIQR